MKKIFLFISLAVVLCMTSSCGDPGDSTFMYEWKDVCYAFDMVKEDKSLEGLQVEITYVDPAAIERCYNYSKFGAWDTVFSHLPWGFIPRMKATIVKPENVEYTASDFPAVIHIRMGISDGDNSPRRLDEKEEFESLEKFNEYINDNERKTYKVYPISTEMGK